MAVIPDPATTNWVPIWNPISTGPIGPPGPIGPTGPQGPSGSSANVLKYRADTASQSMSTDPGNGKMRWNNATQNLSTVLSFDRVTDEGFDATLILQLTATEDNFAIQDQDLAANNQVWKQTGPAVIIGADWFNVPVQFVSGNTSFTNLERLAILVKNKGATGPIGPAGPQGPAGPTGPQGPAGSAAAHHLTHETGGTDAITSLAGSVINSGTIADARLSSNVPLKNASNVFTASQEIDGTSPGFFLKETDQAVDAKLWKFGAENLIFNIYPLNDAGTNLNAGLQLTRAGVLNVPGGLGTTPLNGSQITSGTIPGARLDPNTAYRNVDNIFSTNQTIFSANPILRLLDGAAPADSKIWWIYNTAQLLLFDAYNDAQSVLQGRVVFNRAGTISAASYIEAGRPVAMGYWSAWTPTLTATGGTITITNQYNSAYMIIGKTIFISFMADYTVTGSVTVVYFSLPSGPVLNSNYQAGAALVNNLPATVSSAPGDARIALLAGYNATLAFPTPGRISIIAFFFLA